MILDICRGVDNGRELLQSIMRGVDGVGALRRMLSTVSPGARLNFEETGSTEETYWVVGADEPYPEPEKQTDKSAAAAAGAPCVGVECDGEADTGTWSVKRRYWDQLIEGLGQGGPVGMLSTGDTQKVEAYLCPIHDIAALYEHPITSKKTSILHELVELEDPTIFDHELPGMLVQFKWDAYAREVMVRQFTWYFMMIIAFTVHILSFANGHIFEEMNPTEFRTLDFETRSISRTSLQNASNIWALVSWSAWLICLLISLKVMLIGELGSIMKQGLAAYLRDPQNSFDLMNALLLFICLGLAVAGIFVDVDSQYTDILRAMAVLFCWCCMLFRLICFDRLQKLVLIIFQVRALRN